MRDCNLDWRENPWLEYRENMAGVYDELNYTSPLQASAMRASHRLLERAFDGGHHFERVLEIGAGTGVHLSFVRHGFGQYVMSDHDPKALARAEQKLNGDYGDRLSYAVQRGESLDYPDDSFDRVVAVHVLEHIYPPEAALKEWCRVLKDGGTLSVLLPTDPGLAWRLARCLGPRRHAEARGIAYDYVMAREHVNPCGNLVTILRHHFGKTSEAWWPLSLASVDLNLFYAFHARVSKARA